MASWPCEVCRQHFASRQQLEHHTISVHLSGGGGGVNPNAPPAYAPQPYQQPAATPAYTPYGTNQVQSPHYGGASASSSPSSGPPAYAPGYGASQAPAAASPQYASSPQYATSPHAYSAAPVPPARAVPQQQPAPQAMATPPSYAAMTLPPGWEQIMDPASGRPVFVNHATRETSWTPPQPKGGAVSIPMTSMPAPPQPYQVQQQPQQQHGQMMVPVQVTYSNQHRLAVLGMVDTVAVPVAAGTNGVPYNNSYVFAPDANGPETRPPTGAPRETWTPPAWFRNTIQGVNRRDHTRPPPPDLIVPGNRGTGSDTGGTNFYHCFEKCMVITMIKQIVYRDIDPWQSGNICVPRRNASCGDACMDCCDHQERDFNNPGSCPSWPSPLCCWCHLVSAPLRLLLLVLYLPAMIVFLLIDVIQCIWPLIFFCTGMRCLNRHAWCSWSFGVIDKDDRGTRFRFPGCCWLYGCLKIWFCMVTSRQRHYSICPALVADPSDKEYLALRVPDDIPQ